MMQSFGLQPTDLILVLLLLLNALTFVVYGVDKWRAQGGRWRIPERTLLLLAAFGGALGACLGMVVWNHKTSHNAFSLSRPCLRPAPRAAGILFPAPLLSMLLSHQPVPLIAL